MPLMFEKIYMLDTDIYLITNFLFAEAQTDVLPNIKFPPSQNFRTNVLPCHLSTGGYSYSAYITFKDQSAAMAAIKATNGSTIEGRVLKATYGTTKYCSYFMRGVPCSNPSCLYLHELARPEDCFSKVQITWLFDIFPSFLCSIVRHKFVFRSFDPPLTLHLFP